MPLSLRSLLEAGTAGLHAALARLGSPCTSASSTAERLLQETRELYVAVDDDGVVRAWNHAAEELFGYPAEHALGRPVASLIVPPSSHAAHRAGMAEFPRTGRGRGVGTRVEVEALRADGSLVPVEMTLWAEDTPRGHVFHALGHDLTSRQRHAHVLEVLAAHRRGLLLTDDGDDARRLLCDTVRDAVRCQGVYLYEPVPDLDGGLRLTGESRHLAGPGREVVPLVGPLREHLATPGPGLRLLQEQLGSSPAADALRETGLQTFVLKPLHRDRLVGVLVLGWLVADRATAQADEPLIDLLASEAVLVFERIAVQDELRRAARTDPLTGVANRRAFDEGLSGAVAQALEDGGALGLVVLDLDRFKSFNDAHGHPAGDVLLAEVAAAWQRELEGSGWLARVGGDEFALVLPGADDAAARRQAERLTAATPPAVGVTCGVATLRPGGTVHDLRHEADADLYARKRHR